MVSGLLQRTGGTVSSQGGHGGVFETQVCWGTAIFLVFFPVTVKQEDMCVSNVGVTVSSVQSAETTVSAAHRQSKLSE